MPRLSDPREIRRRLELDRGWAAYALGDLAPGYREQSEWYGADEYPDAIALVYRAGETPILFMLGDLDGVGAVVEELPAEAQLSISIRPEHLPAVQARWQVLKSNAMWRMLLHASAPTPPRHPQVTPIWPRDAGALQALFADGKDTGEEPDFFFPHMLEAGTYFGVQEAGEWVAAAGTHLVAEAEGVGTVGNVYVRRDRRGRGLARTVVGAVIDHLRSRQIRTIGLNVRQTNLIAVRVYERLGFRCYCPFLEGSASFRSRGRSGDQPPTR